ncbi:hypothetical protein AB0J38_26945 [Streptomyces sp. NPDC050095]|uniref:hypothetical protein n=1 Tax=unclassified Streptomyces TaxID=2593676 RepID=UPI00342AF6E8
MTPAEITSGTASGITSDERASLEKALYDALNPLAAALRSRETGLPAERMWDAEPVAVTLSVLATWKVVDAEVKRLTAHAAATAGAYGASYEQLGAAWGITRQGARKKWPEAVGRQTARADRLQLFGGSAELVRVEPGGWTWVGVGADGVRSAAEGAAAYETREEAAAHAGAFLKEHADAAG